MYGLPELYFMLFREASLKEIWSAGGEKQLNEYKTSLPLKGEHMGNISQGRDGKRGAAAPEGHFLTIH